MLESVSEIVDALEPSQFQQPQVEAAFAAFSNILSRAEGRRSARVKRAATEDFDDEEAEALEAENEAEEELFDQVSLRLSE